MPTVIPAPKAELMSPRFAFLITGISDRKVVEEEAGRETGATIFEEVAVPEILESRLTFADARTTGEGLTNEERAAAACGPWLSAAGTNPLRTLRSWRVRDMPGRTERFLERESFGAIALKECSDPVTIVCVWCGAAR